MEPLYVHLAIWLFPVSKPNIQIQIETPFGKWQFHGSFSKYCELWELKRQLKSGLLLHTADCHKKTWNANVLVACSSHSDCCWDYGAWSSGCAWFWRAALSWDAPLRGPASLLSFSTAADASLHPPSFTAHRLSRCCETRITRYTPLESTMQLCFTCFPQRSP